LILAEFPDAAAPLNNAANVYFLQGENDRAKELYERAIAAAPKEGGVHLNLGILLHAMGDEEASAVAVRKGLELAGDLQHAYFLLGLSTQNENRASGDEALQGAEIEALLAKAMAEVPTSSKSKDGQATGEEVTVASREGEQTMETRPGGAKASEAGAEESGADSSRLFWMDLQSRP
jgi:tetratricopeptide (TPR) repeat protein